MVSTENGKPVVHWNGIKFSIIELQKFFKQENKKLSKRIDRIERILKVKT